MRSPVLRGVLAACVLLLAASPAPAQLFRAYLASDGLDTNPCTLAQPCRLLPAALAAVASGGEIWLLDSANYNASTVTVAKSVTILAVPGALGSVVAIGGPAISITASGLDVALRNLVVVPLAGGGGTHGIDMPGNSSLTIENAVFGNIAAGGHAVRLPSAGNLKVVDTTFRNLGGSGVYLGSAAHASVSRSAFLKVDVAVTISNSGANFTRAYVTDTVISGANHGVKSESLVTGAESRIFLTRCAIDQAVNGITSGATASSQSIVLVNNSSINALSYWSNTNASAYVYTYGNNQTGGSTSGNVPSLVALQ